MVLGTRVYHFFMDDDDDDNDDLFARRIECFWREFVAIIKYMYVSNVQSKIRHIVSNGNHNVSRLWMKWNEEKETIIIYSMLNNSF